MHLAFNLVQPSTVTERFANDDAIGGGMLPEQYGAFIAKEPVIWKDIVKRVSIKAD